MFSERDASRVLNQLTTAVVVLDEGLLLAGANSAAESLITTSVYKLQGQPLARLFPEAATFCRTVASVFDEPRAFTERDLLLHRPNQEPVKVDCSVAPWWRGSTRPAGVVLELGSTERQQRLQAEENMLLQNQISTALMRGLAHEVKNPLGGIRGAAQLLERELPDRRQHEYTQIIIGEADRLRKLVDRMLGPSGQVQKSVLNIHEVLEHVRQVVAMEAGPAVRVQRDYDPSLPDVEADRDLLIQAFLNLLRNAVQAVSTGGTVTLRTRAQRKFTIGAVLHRLVIRTDVIDDGPGVAPDIVDSIFFPMVSGRADGSGLGLPIAQSLVQRQGGLIEFASEPGRTVFTVWLPLASASRSSA